MGIVVLTLKASLDEMNGDTKRCRGKVFMIQWLNSSLYMCECECVCVFGKTDSNVLKGLTEAGKGFEAWMWMWVCALALHSCQNGKVQACNMMFFSQYLTLKQK